MVDAFYLEQLAEGTSVLVVLLMKYSYHGDESEAEGAIQRSVHTLVDAREQGLLDRAVSGLKPPVSKVIFVAPVNANVPSSKSTVRDVELIIMGQQDCLRLYGFGLWAVRAFCSAERAKEEQKKALESGSPTQSQPPETHQ